MPRTIHRLRAFLASASDTAEERERLERIVLELNRTWADTLSLEVELLRWETHAYPAFNTDPQAVINEEIGDDYEIFVGLLWGRFGTPTPRALSGTQEEFERAYERFKADPNSVSLLFYFKEQAIPPSKINPAEIDRIQKFRGSLGDLGGLYWTFETVADFEALVRPHLAKVVQGWKARIESQNTALPTRVDATKAQNRSVSDATDDIEADELGYLDYMEMADRANSIMIAALQRMTSAMEELGTNVKKRSAAAAELTASPTLSSAKAVANETANDLQTFSNTMAAEIPIFSDAYGDVLRGFSGAATISLETSDSNERVSTALSEVEQLRSALETTRGQLTDFTENLRSTPRMTTYLNRARQKAVRVLESVDAEFGKALSNSMMVETSIRNLLTRKSD